MGSDTTFVFKEAGVNETVTYYVKDDRMYYDDAMHVLNPPAFIVSTFRVR